MTCKNRTNDPRDNDFYEDWCEEHPLGCHVELIAPGVEYHQRPAYSRPPAPGALEAQEYDQQIIDADTAAMILRINRQLDHDAAYAKGQ